MVASGSVGELGKSKKIEDAYQNATAKDTTRTAALISDRMNFIRPLLTSKSSAVALPPRAITKITALMLAELKLKPWNGGTSAWGKPGFSFGYPRTAVTARHSMTMF